MGDDDSDASVPDSVGVARESLMPTAFLWDARWWGAEIRAVFKVVGFFALPSFGLAVGNVIAVVVNALMMGSLATAEISGDDAGPQLTQLLFLLLGLMGGMLVSLGISFWALWIWLLRLTACADLHLRSAVLSKEGLLSSTATFNSIKGRLMSLWTVGSVFLLAPAVPLAVLIALTIVRNMKVLGKTALELPTWAPFALVPGIIVLSIITLAYVLTLTVVSARFNQNPLAASTIALQICVRHAVPVTIATTVIALLNVIVTAPQLLFSGTLIGDFLSNNMWVGMALQVWFGATAAFMWPVSVMAFAKMMRPMFSEERVP